jgi:hypothetical protein
MGEEEEGRRGLSSEEAVCPNRATFSTEEAKGQANKKGKESPAQVSGPSPLTGAAASQYCGMFGSHKAPRRLQDRELRFGVKERELRFGKAKQKIKLIQKSSDEVEMSWLEPVKGTNMELEKGYLRLTAVSFLRSPKAPDPSTIRPESVLKKSLELVKQKYATRQKDYVFICEQFKSIRLRRFSHHTGKILLFSTSRTISQSWSMNHTRGSA